MISCHYPLRNTIQYLRSLLEGTVYEAITGLPLSAANNEKAIGLLRMDFESHQVTISRHMNFLLRVEAVSSDKNVCM